MKKLTHHQLTSLPIVSGFIAALTLLAFFVITVPQAQAASTLESGERLITIHDGGTEKGIVTKATTLRQAFATASIPVSDHDRVEPGIDTPLTGNNYEINLYRARPVTIVDGGVQQRIMSPYRTPKQIVEHAGMTLNDEDKTTMSASTDAVSGLGLRLTIDRATPFTLVLYGKSVPSHTMTRTVGDMLAEKKITLGANDTLSVPISTPITAGMTVELWRNGVQTQTREEDVAFTTKQIQDADQPVGYKKVQTPGVAGKKMVTYEITMKNGQELSRKEIQSVSTKQATEQVEIVGSKPSFTGDFAAALAKLRSCEGGYNSWNPAGPYYGAYQFDQRTWSSVSSAPYGSATPAEQDAAAYALYQRRGWQPWPHCGAGLPDTYR